MAPPKHMPVPMRCTKSTARMVARGGRASMLQRLRRPKAARTKTTRRDSRRELMDYHLLSVVDEESERYGGRRLVCQSSSTARGRMAVAARAMLSSIPEKTNWCRGYKAYQ